MHTLKLTVALGAGIVFASALAMSCGGDDTGTGGAGAQGGTSVIQGGGGAGTNAGGNNGGGGTILTGTGGSGGTGGKNPTGTGGTGGMPGTGGSGGGGNHDASVQIGTVRGTADGTGLTLPIQGALVTYLKPVAIGADPPGFFLQAEKAGPAIFVSVDPATISPGPPKVGDLVNLTVTSVLTTGDGMKVANGVSGVAIVSAGHPIAPLVTDISAASDTVTGLDGYEARVISGSGTITGAFVSAGAPQVSAPWKTTGVDDPNLALRIPPAVRDAFDLEADCVVTLNYGTMWRHLAKAEPTVLQVGDVTATCPAPTVALATATALTTVAVTFSRSVDAATLLANGSQFTFDGGLTGSAAVMGATPDTVLVTTSAQTGGTTYHVAVANTLKDVTDGAVAAGNSTAFTGFQTVAALVFNELSPGITGGHDLIELLVTASGTVKDIVITEENGAADVVLATLPDVQVTAGDIIVVHLTTTGTTGIAASSETTGKTQFAAASFSANYDGAWDFLGSATAGMTNSARWLKINAPGTNALIDGVYVIGSGAPPGTFDASLLAIQTSGAWLPATCGGVACGPATTPTDRQVCVDFTGVGNSPAGASASRKAGMNTHTAADWTIGTQTIGSANP